MGQNKIENEQEREREQRDIYIYIREKVARVKKPSIYYAFLPTHIADLFIPRLKLTKTISNVKKQNPSS